MLLVPYPFASILSIVFPSLRFLWNLHAFIFGLRAVYSFACFASKTQGLCSAFPRPSLEFVRFCLSRIVLRTSPHKHRVCAVLFPWSPWSLYAYVMLCYVMLCYVMLCYVMLCYVMLCYVMLCYVMRTSPHKHRVCAVLLPSVPYWVCTLMCRVLLYVLRLTNFGFVQCLHLGSLWNFARVRFHVLRASPRKHQVCAVLFPRPLLSLYACVCHGLLCVLCLTNIGFVQCFSLRIARKFVRVITRQFSFNRDR